jgi:pSer/pThr/pTyr-binding forkhead associated (FHA) protein
VLLQDAWLVKDLSTNGTFINGNRIGKGKEAVARVGDHLQLSCVDPKAPENHME